jgi:hypothetical protein
MRNFLPGILVLFSLNSFALHPTHVSIVNMDIQRDKMLIDYSFHIFLDDYNYLLYGVFHDELAAARSDSTINMNNIIVKNYIERNFQIIIDGKNRDSDFKGIKMEDNDVWFYFQVKLVQIPDTIGISNKLFLGLYRDQINLLILSDGSDENGFTFDFNNTEQRFALKNI